MQNRGYFRPAVASAAFLTLLALSTPASAYQPYGGGLRAQAEQWPSRTFQTVFDNANVIKSSIDKAWAAQTDPICDMVRKYATTPGLLPNGISVLKVTCNFADTGSLFIDPSQLGHDVVRLRYDVSGNSIDLITSKPAPDAGTVAAGILTGGATAAAEAAADNPEFSIDFDIRADVTASIENMSLGISSAVASLANVHFNSKNFLASVGLTLQPSIRSEVEGDVKKQQVDLKSQVSNSLALINVAFAPMKGQGYTQVQASFTGGKLVLDFVGKTYQVATTGPGRISGAVYFTPPNGQPSAANICAAMSVRAETPDSFNDISQFNVTNMQQVGQVQPIAGGPVPGQRYACSYSVTSVPVGVPVTIVVHAPSTSTGLPAPSPVGWNGTVTLPGFGAETRLRSSLTTSYAVNQQPVKHTALSPAATVAHPVLTTSRSNIKTAPALLSSVPSPSVGGNTASNMNFTLVWQGMPR
jgi:hypothetical protein